MPKSRVALTLDTRTLRRVDRLVRDARFPNRSQAIEAAVTEQLDRLERLRLVDECARLDPAVERAMAEEGMPDTRSGIQSPSQAHRERQGCRSCGGRSLYRPASTYPLKLSRIACHPPRCISTEFSPSASNVTRTVTPAAPGRNSTAAERSPIVYSRS